MSSKVLAIVCIQALLIQAVFSQAIGVVPGCGCNNVLPLLGALENQVLTTPTTIIQDSTVANNLANALQLLIVSNLLSSTLPFGAPPCGCGAPACGCGALQLVPEVIAAPLPSCGCQQQYTYII